MELMERASEAVKSALDVNQPVDDAIIEYLSGLCLSAASDGDLTHLIEAIEDCTLYPHALAGDLYVSAADRGRQMVARLKGEENPAVTMPHELARPAGKTLSITATEFKPRPVSQAPSSIRPPGPASDSFTCLDIGATGATDLLSSWFPEYAITELHLLYDSLGKNLWLTVEELQIMEGEVREDEPYSTKFNLPSKQEKQGQSKAPSLSSAQDFPSLSGSSHFTFQPSKEPKMSAKDALLLWPPPASMPIEPDGTEIIGQRSTAFWKQGSSGNHSKQDSHPVACLEGSSIPVVATGEQLTKLYEEARADARTRMIKREECFRLAAKAYVAGNRSQAQALSREARAHSEAMAAADSRAAAAIYRSRNQNSSGSSGSFVDLHGLHVKEAISLLLSIIEERRSQLQGGTLKVCTGVGKHTNDPRRTKAEAQGRLSCAVEAHFTKRQVVFREIEPGLYSCSL